MALVTCRYCGETVTVTAFNRPIRYREDPADAFGPRRFVIIGGDWLLHRCDIPEGAESREAVLYSDEIHQAAGMVVVQTGAPIGDALQMLRDRAVVERVTLDEIATAVIERSIRFGPGA